MRYEVYLFENPAQAKLFEEGFEAALGEDTALRFFSIGTQTLGVVEDRSRSRVESRDVPMQSVARALMGLPVWPEPTGPAHEAMVARLLELYHQTHAPSTAQGSPSARETMRR